MKFLCLTSNKRAKDVRYFKKKYNMKLSKNISDITTKYDLVIAHGFDKIIPQKYFKIPKYGIFIIHSSDLPKGRGWAPIYHAVKNADKEYVISLIQVDRHVDAGNILLKIRIKKPKFISNDNLRIIDEEASIQLIKKFFSLFNKKNTDLQGIKQDNALSTYKKKRAYRDNKLDKNDTIKSQILAILATSKDYQSFITIGNERVKIMAVLEKEYHLKDLKYSFEDFISKGTLDATI